uniref:Uncharacterized protein n=1 Tax=Arundo donax TaxID=35708 RepID=A0A0A9HWG3_ARUDO
MYLSIFSFFTPLCFRCTIYFFTSS